MGKKRNKNGYKKARTEHSKYRAWQRYDMKLNRLDIKEIINKIKTDKAYLVRRRSCRVTEWTVEIKEKTVRVLYDKIHCCILTFLPRQETFPIRKDSPIQEKFQ